MEECSSTFQQLKEYLSKSPIMSKLEEDEFLFAYIAVASHAVSLLLVRDDNGVHRPVYYVSKSLHEAEVHYLPLEKAILAIDAEPPTLLPGSYCYGSNPTPFPIIALEN